MGGWGGGGGTRSGPNALDCRHAGWEAKVGTTQRAWIGGVGGVMLGGRAFRVGYTAEGRAAGRRLQVGQPWPPQPAPCKSSVQKGCARCSRHSALLLLPLLAGLIPTGGGTEGGMMIARAEWRAGSGTGGPRQPGGQGGQQACEELQAGWASSKHAACTAQRRPGRRTEQWTHQPRGSTPYFS